VAARILRLEKAIDEAIQKAPAELGSLSRFPSPRQLMGYSGLVAREALQRQSRAQGFDHQDRQCSSQKGVGGRALSQTGSRLAFDRVS
jgi:hypothetical protein